MIAHGELLLSIVGWFRGHGLLYCLVINRRQIKTPYIHKTKEVRYDINLNLGYP